MRQLFSENFKIAETDDDIVYNQGKYGNLDPIYVATGSILERKLWVEKLWSTYSKYADDNFLIEIKSPGCFHKRTWELYLGAVALSKKYNLINKKSAGPDLHIEYQGVDIWIEATAPDRGDVDPAPQKPDLKPGEMYSNVENVEEANRAKALRMTQAMLDKKRQYEKNLKKGYLKDTDPYIIAINGYDFSGLVTDSAYLARLVFFGAGPEQIKLNNGSLGNRSFAFRPYIEKRVDEKIIKIDVGLFNKEEYSSISAAIFNTDHIINTPKEDARMGSNLMIIKNPKADNPLPKDFWKHGQECFYKGNQLGYINYEM